MKILYISYSCNSSFGISSIRVGEVLKFLSKNNQILFLSPDKGFVFKNVKNTIIKPPSKNPSSLSLYYSNLIKPLFDESDSLQEENWVEEVINYIKKRNNKLGKFDLVYVNIHPICLIKAGKVAKSIFDAKLVIDMQDPFYFNPYRRTLSIFENRVKNKEKKLLNGVDGLILCQKSGAKTYSKSYPNIKVTFSSNIHPSNLPKPQSIEKNTVNKIIYGGSLFIGRDLFPLLDALSKVSNKFEIEVLGSFSKINQQRYKNYQKIKWMGRITNDKYYDYLNNKANLGVVLQSFEFKNTGISAVASKTFEYLYLNKPIIYIGPEGDNADLIRKYSNNCFIMTNPNTQKKQLTNFLNEFKNKQFNTKKSYYEDFTPKKIFAPVSKLIKTI